jgi:8-oxo-dGTP diphosphatase
VVPISKPNAKTTIIQQLNFIFCCMDIKAPINVACAIIIYQDKILVAQRSEKMSLPLKWEFPGGKVKNDESAEECIERELKEELNISIKILKRLKVYFHDYGNFSLNLIPFIAEYLSGELILAEHKAASWLSKNELSSLDWAAADVPILNDFINLSHA